MEWTDYVKVLLFFPLNQSNFEPRFFHSFVPPSCFCEVSLFCFLRPNLAQIVPFPFEHQKFNTILWPSANLEETYAKQKKINVNAGYIQHSHFSLSQTTNSAQQFPQRFKLQQAVTKDGLAHLLGLRMSPQHFKHFVWSPTH